MKLLLLIPLCVGVGMLCHRLDRAHRLPILRSRREPDWFRRLCGAGCG